MVLRERKGAIDGYEWRCRTKVGENPHDVCKSSGAKSNERGTFECDKGVGGTRVRYNFGLLEGLQLPIA
ncbi:hypothetical protein TNCV_3347191 [Trichonephila clavipes]|nr:hypothetical protein TNCV_3347191 [Trichonephila clavipes]